MSEEEKNALHVLANTEFETYEYTCHCLSKNCNANSCLECYEKMQKIIINLIERQQKEIERLQEENMGLITRLRADGLIERDNYWKRKIINAVKNLEEMSLTDDTFDKMKNYAVLILEDLLKE